MADITVTVDGVKYADHVEPRMLLVHYLREVVQQDRDSHRMRHVELRRMHGAA